MSRDQDYGPGRDAAGFPAEAFDRWLTDVGSEGCRRQGRGRFDDDDDDGDQSRGAGSARPLTTSEDRT